MGEQPLRSLLFRSVFSSFSFCWSLGKQPSSLPALLVLKSAAILRCRRIMLEVACLSLPVLISCSSSILSEYVDDEVALESDQSLPRSRTDLVM